MYDFRRAAGKLADAKQSPEARNILKSLNQDIEDLNVAARRKQVRFGGQRGFSCGNMLGCFVG